MRYGYNFYSNGSIDRLIDQIDMKVLWKFWREPHKHHYRVNAQLSSNSRMTEP